MMGLDRKLLAAAVLVAAFSNAGNYGLSLNLFAFGEVALAHASLYFATMAALSYTFGVFVASSGSLSAGLAVKNLLKLPAIYAVLLAVLINSLGWRLPLPVVRSLETLSGASIPALLVLIGVQLHRARWSSQFWAMGLANGMRLLVSPLLALGLAAVFGIRGAAYQAGVSEAAMPTAIVTTVLATEYEVEPTFVTACVVLSTLLSPLTLTPLLAYLGA
jgi:predicted permease